MKGRNFFVVSLWLDVHRSGLVKSLFENYDAKEDFKKMYQQLARFEKFLQKRSIRYPRELFEEIFSTSEFDDYHLYKPKQKITVKNFMKLEPIYFEDGFNYVRIPFSNKIISLFLKKEPLKELIQKELLAIEYVGLFKLKAFFLYLPAAVNAYLVDLFKL